MRDHLPGARCQSFRPSVPRSVGVPIVSPPFPALQAGIYMAAMGPRGLRDTAWRNMKNTAYLHQVLDGLNGFEFPFSGNHFNEFFVRFPGSAKEMNRELLARNIIGGYELRGDYPELGECVLLCATEMNSRDDILRFADYCKYWSQRNRT